MPYDRRIPILTNNVHPCHEVVHMDYFIPGCPPDADAILNVLGDLANGRPVHLPKSLTISNDRQHMATTLVIDPITRIEGHGKVVIELDDDHNVTDAKLHVVEFRGYERFIQGHPYWEAPVLMQRICGICFVSHHLAGAKSLDDLIGAGPASGTALTPTAIKMRRLGHYAQMLQSHVTAYFYLVVPRMLFGIDAAPSSATSSASSRRIPNWSNALSGCVSGARS